MNASKLHLIDGTYELFRAYYGVPGVISPNGVQTGATRGLLRSILSLLKGPGVTHVACAFDHVIESFRNALYSGYKTGEGIEPDLLAQFPLAERAVAALGVVVWPMIEFETDDALATAAHRFEKDGSLDQIVICSPDKDMAQCVRGRRVVTLDRMRRILRDEAGVIEKFGVSPGSIPDYLALVGDSADGVPGIPGWGPRSTAQVLARYEKIERIPDDPSRWDVDVRGSAALARNLAGRREEAFLYRILTTLRTDVPLPEDLEELRWRGVRRDELLEFCEEIGDGGFAKSV